MNKKRLKIMAALTVLFLSGIITGVSVTLIYVRKNVDKIMKGDYHFISDNIHRRINKKLELTPEQSLQLRDLTREAVAELNQLREQFRPLVNAIVLKKSEKLRQLLSPSQKSKLDELIKNFQKKRLNRITPTK